AMLLPALDDVDDALQPRRDRVAAARRLLAPEHIENGGIVRAALAPIGIGRGEMIFIRHQGRRLGDAVILRDKTHLLCLFRPGTEISVDLFASNLYIFCKKTASAIAFRRRYIYNLSIYIYYMSITLSSHEKSDAQMKNNPLILIGNETSPGMTEAA